MLSVSLKCRIRTSASLFADDHTTVSLQRTQPLQNPPPYRKFSEIRRPYFYSHIFYHSFIFILVNFLNIGLLISFSSIFRAVFRICLHPVLLICYSFCICILWSSFLYFCHQIRLCMKMSTFLLCCLHLFYSWFIMIQDYILVILLWYMAILSPIRHLWCLNTLLRQKGQKRAPRSRNCTGRCTKIILHARHLGLFRAIFLHYSLNIRTLCIFIKIRHFSVFYWFLRNRPVK